MKSEIHPTYYKSTVKCSQCGTTFETGSILETIKVETCANCHPFYTGKQNTVQADGRVDRFNKRFEESKKQKEEHLKLAAEREKRRLEREALKSNEEA